MIKRKIVLQFIAGADEDNNYRYKKKTLRNIRPELTDEQMIEFIRRFCALTAFPLAEAVVVDERQLILEEEEELIEVIPQEEPVSILLKEGEDPSEKGVTTAPLKNSAVAIETDKEEITPLIASERSQELDQTAMANRKKSPQK